MRWQRWQKGTAQAAGVLVIVLTQSAAGDATVPAGDAPAHLWVVGDVPSARGPGVVRARRIDVDWNALADAGAGERVILELFDGGSVTGTVESRRSRAPHRWTLTGRLETVPPGAFMLSVHGAALAGVVRGGGAVTYRIRGSADGFLNLEAIDEAALPWCGLDGAPRFDAGAGPALDRVEPGRAAGPGAGDDGSVIDLLVVYTRAARNAAGGTDNIGAEIDLLVAFMNTAFDNGLVEPDMNLVYAREIATDEGLITLGNLTSRDDGVADEVHDLRDAYGADEVALVRSGGGGVANGLSSLDPFRERLAFCINGRDTMPYIIAHEVGHNLGCCHAIGDGGGCGVGLLFEFSNGHRFFGDSGTQWRTVMAYSPGFLTAQYSNPLVEFDGVPTGIPAGEERAADNVLTINIAAPTIATWRCSNPICSDLDLPGDAPDCNENGIPDLCEIALGRLADLDHDGVPDECVAPRCRADIDGSGVVGVEDLLAVLAAWGNAGGPEDLDENGVVDLGDLLIVLSAWGPCFTEAAVCCLGDGGCTIETEDACISAGGIYQPGVATCAADGCGAGACRPADECADAPIVAEGIHSYSTLDATTGGPDLPAGCDEGNGVRIRKDVWVSYRASCDGVATASVCESTYDTRLAVYQAGDCASALLACRDDACGEDGTRSEVSFPVRAGEQYLVRIGSARFERGEGSLVITCE